MTKKDTTTKQVKVKPKKTLKNGNPINVSRQFGQPNGNPRHNGAWKKEDTARYKLEQMLKLTEEELVAVTQDPTAPYFEHKLASCIMKGQWKEVEGMINQVYGTPKQTIDVKEIQAPTPLEDLQVVKVEKKKKK